ncbi:hypothetical protein BSKO_11490 [Bryopsis sp. KO-2023]|nr:hypothetical protein BSKO_11490 [Bryopsis sp. KO-2023]
MFSETFPLTISQLVWAVIAFEIFRWVFRWLWRRVKYDLHKMPGPRGLPVIGHAHLIEGGNQPRFTTQVHRWALEYGKVYRLKMMSKDLIIVSDPKFVQEHVHGPGQKDLPKIDSYSKNFNKVFTPYDVSGIFTMAKTDEKYKSFRKTLASAFSTEALRRGYPALLAKSKQLTSKIGSITADGSSIDMQDLALKCAFDCIGHFAYGLDFDATKKGTHPLLEAIISTTADSRVGALKPFWKLYKKLAPFSAVVQHSKRMHELLYSEYEKIMDAIDLSGPPPAEDDRSIRAQLMRLRNPLNDNKRATREETYCEMATFLIGGVDTTSHQLCWVLVCLSTHLDVQDRVYSELKEHGLAGVDGKDPEYSILTNLTYLNHALKEGLRLIPVGPGGSGRSTQTDLDVLGYRVPKGTTIMAQRRTLNTCPWVWENADKYNPDRWASKSRGVDGGTTEGERKIWTFGSGARSCVGQRLAMMQLQMMLVVLLSKFRFTLDPRMGGFQGAMDRGYDTLVFSCEGGLWLKASPRE